MRWWKRLKKDNSEKLKELKEDIENEGGLEKKDTFAMIFSAMLVFMPVVILVLLGIAALILIPLMLL